jgi:hypothetical protein
LDILRSRVGENLAEEEVVPEVVGMTGPAREAIALESRGAGEGRRGWEGGRGEGGSSTRDEVPTLHNLDLRQSGSR